MAVYSIKRIASCGIDPTAFRRTECNIQNHPELCHYGNAATDVLITPGLHSLDLSLAKNWTLRERTRVAIPGRSIQRAEYATVRCAKWIEFCDE